MSSCIQRFCGKRKVGGGDKHRQLYEDARDVGLGLNDEAPWFSKGHALRRCPWDIGRNAEKQANTISDWVVACETVPKILLFGIVVPFERHRDSDPPDPLFLKEAFYGQGQSGQVGEWF